MEAKEQVLKAMREIGAPVNAGKIAEVTGLDRKVVDKAFDALKKEGAIVSPVRRVLKIFLFLRVSKKIFMGCSDEMPLFR